jgi:two-component sensor histidine kinase
MGARIRAYDWNSSVLGLPENWPQSLRGMVKMILNSPQPMMIRWGAELIQFYNDAYIPMVETERHPKALGERSRDFCAETWDIVGPQIDHVMTGKGSIWHEDLLVPIRRNGRRENAWWSYSFAPIDDKGKVGGVLVICNEVTAQHLSNEAFKDQTRRFHLLFEQASSFMAVLLGPDHIFAITNPAFRRLAGDRDFIGKPVREIMAEIVPQGYLEALDEAYRTRKPYVGARMPVTMRPVAGGPLKELFVDFVIQPMVEANGEISGVFIEGVDVTDHVRAEQHLRLINDELKHRVKNTLSIVGGIASQTLHGNATDAGVETFQDRLAALGRAQDILTATSQLTISVRDVVENALAPHRTGGGRISVSGPDVIVGSKQALSLGMAIHELATNAIKYGSLSDDRGRIDISWRSTHDRGVSVFQFSWVESDGPPVQRPSEKGFGSELIEGRLAWDFKGRVEVSYEPTGFICRLIASPGNLGLPAPS